METGTARNAKEGFCAECYTKAKDKCARCNQRWYCSRYCQQKNWLLEHKGDCGLSDLPLPMKIPAPPTRLISASVERPVFSEKHWGKLLEAMKTGPRVGAPKGLTNLGNSCYMNAVLQGIFHGAPPLLAACREHRAKSKCAELKSGCFRCDLEAMACACLESEPASELSIGEPGLVEAPTTNAAADHATSGVQQGAADQRAAGTNALADNVAKSKAAIQQVATWLPRLGEFNFGMQEDADEYLRSLLRLIEHEELREHAEAVDPLPANADLTASPCRIFGGLLVSQCTCTNRPCAASSFSFETFMDLSLNITEATDSVEDTLRLFTAPERLDKKNGWKCQSCQETVRARKQLLIYSVPTCLVLQLKRFRAVMGAGQRGKVTKPVTFAARLNLAPFLSTGAPEAGRPLWYELRAVVVHLDKAGFSHFGHYVAFVRCNREAGSRTGATGAWYLLDDKQVLEVAEEVVFRQQAYLLIYSRAATTADGPSQLGLRRGTSGGGNAGDHAKKAASVLPPESAPSPAKCRGISGNNVCSFFASSDGLCTQCYTKTHGKPPPAPDQVEVDELPQAPPSAALNATVAKPAAKASNSQAVCGKAKKVGPNDACPCGSGSKYKKCHGKK